MRDFISIPVMGLTRFARAARGQWGIENRCQRGLVFTDCEDDSQIRDVRGARERLEDIRASFPPID
ncbi:MAG: hypothetical protein ACE5KM_02615 [Planctomycetaceae bacterium]